MAVDINTIDKDHIKSTLLETITAVLNTLPYNNQLECDCVLGIRLDEGTEFFVSLHDQIHKIASPNENKDIIIDDQHSSPYHREPNSEMSHSTEKQNHVLSVPSLGNLPIGTKFILPNKDAQYLLDVLKKQEALETESMENTLEYESPRQENLPVHEPYQHFTMDQQSAEYELVHEPAVNESQELPVVGATKMEVIKTDCEQDTLEYEAEIVTERSDVPSPAKEHSVQLDTSTGSALQKMSCTKIGGKRNFKHIYKVPQGHLKNAPCDCCHILQRYREKDKNVRRRRVVREETGEAPPRLPPSKVYKLPANHLDKCSCCEVLRKKREYWKNLSRRRRSKNKPSSTKPHWIDLNRHSPV